MKIALQGSVPALALCGQEPTFDRLGKVRPHLSQRFTALYNPSAVDEAMIKFQTVYAYEAWAQSVGHSLRGVHGTLVYVVKTLTSGEEPPRILRQLFQTARRLYG